ncbi:MAG TPA: hypothetical protein VE861_00520 [Gemmatimonadaceae bacterium]|nr:hypothetical protein [Gemmatimonadaceae bacterium]
MKGSTLLAFCGMMALVAGAPSGLEAQSFDDAIFMDRRVLCAGLVYTREQWSEYWEGTLKRENGNIGTLTTQQATWMMAYGVTNRLNVLASLPYVWTNASDGVLQGQSGSQDLTVGVKYDALTTPLTTKGTLHAIAIVSGSVPTSSYTPDFYPMSIGSRSRRATARAMVSWQAHAGMYTNATIGYTRRGNVTLDRPAYYTNDQLFLTSEVQMPDVRDMSFTVGYQRAGKLYVPITVTRQQTLGGGDIRRQDMPFVSNRMNWTRLEGRVQYTVPKLPGVALHAGGSRVIAGRNVGQATTVMAGVLIAGKL